MRYEDHLLLGLSKVCETDVCKQEGGNTPVAALAKVNAGEKVTFDWGSWGSSHSGFVFVPACIQMLKPHPRPLMTYLADCGTAGCASFKGDSGAIWASE